MPKESPLDDPELVSHPCGMCEQHDDHPKHVFVLDVATGEEQRRHMDCCSSVGCGTCASRLMGADGKKGAELREHLVASSPVAAVSTDPVPFPATPDGGNA